MVPPPARKRRATLPSTTPPAKAPYKRNSKPLSAAAIANADKAKKRNDAQQVAITFDTVEKYRVGMKLLLPDSIYESPNDVSPLPLCFNCHIPL
jgi:hypothetical protein